MFLCALQFEKHPLSVDLFFSPLGVCGAQRVGNNEGLFPHLNVTVSVMKQKHVEVFYLARSVVRLTRSLHAFLFNVGLGVCISLTS